MITISLQQRHKQSAQNGGMKPKKQSTRSTSNAIGDRLLRISDHVTNIQKRKSYFNFHKLASCYIYHKFNFEYKFVSVYTHQLTIREVILNKIIISDSNF